MSQPLIPFSAGRSRPTNPFSIACPTCGSEDACKHDVACEIKDCTLWGGHEGPCEKGPGRHACGDFVADGHEQFDHECGACREASSDAPEWTA